MSDLVDTAVLKRYQVIKKVGEGAYGQVWKAKEKRSKETVALKKIYDAFRNQTDAQRTYREIMFMQLLDHPNIVKLLSCIRPSNDSDIYITMQYMQTDLTTVLKTGVLKDIHKQYIFAQVVSAIAYMHSGDLIHRDLKPANILLNAKCEAKVCDFGLVKGIHQGNSIMTENVATRWYRAPQMLLGSRKYCKKVDTWSLGCILAEILTGRPILQGISTLNQIQKIIQLVGTPSISDFKASFPDDDQIFELYSALPIVKKRSLKDFFPNADFITLDLLSKLLQFNPKKRLSIQQVLEHPLITKYSEKVSSNKALCPFTIPNDGMKLELQAYRELIYQEIQTGSRQSQTSTTFSRQVKQRTIPVMKNWLNDPKRKPYKIQRGNSSSLLHKLKSRSSEKLSFFAEKPDSSVLSRLSQQIQMKKPSVEHSELGGSIKNREQSKVKRYNKYQIYNMKDQVKRDSMDLKIRCTLYEQYSPKKKPFDEHNSSFIAKVHDNINVTPQKKGFQNSFSPGKMTFHTKSEAILSNKFRTENRCVKQIKQNDLQITAESTQIKKGSVNYSSKVQRSKSKNRQFSKKDNNPLRAFLTNNVFVSHDKPTLDCPEHQKAKANPVKQSLTPILDQFQYYIPESTKNPSCKTFQQNKSTKYSIQSIQNPENKCDYSYKTPSNYKNTLSANYFSPKYSYYKTKV